MLCFGLDRRPCFCLHEARRKLQVLLDVVARFGLTGGLIALALMTIHLAGRHWGGEG